MVVFFYFSLFAAGGGGVGAVDWDSISQTRTEDGEMKTMASRAER